MSLMPSIDTLPSTDSLLSAVLPWDVVLREVRFLLPSNTAHRVLYPHEAEGVRGAVPRRVQEFATGRICARSALREFGYFSPSVARGHTREPVWPNGIIGSITHCRGYCAVAVARRSQYACLGIDAEPNEPVASDIVGEFALPTELDALARLGRNPSIHWAKVLFSVKETIFKAAFPGDRQWRGLRDVQVDLTADGRFSAVAVRGPKLPTFQGRWLVCDDLILSAAYG